MNFHMSDTLVVDLVFIRCLCIAYNLNDQQCQLTFYIF